MPIRRKPFLIEPGSLLGNPSFTDMAITVKTLCEQSGLDLSDIVYSPTLRIPVPVYIPTSARRPWPVKPEVMWHPLFWLPRRLHGLKDIELPGMSAPVTEDNERWGIRVLAEYQAGYPYEQFGQWWVPIGDTAGIPLIEYPLGEDGEEVLPEMIHDFRAMTLVRPATKDDENLLPIYDVVDGTWLDVPYLVGVDIDTPEGLQRMTRWLEGAPDPDLDSLNLDDYMVARGRADDWICDTLYRVLDHSEVDPVLPPTLLIDDYINGSHALMAGSFIDDVEELVDSSEPLEMVKEALANLIAVATGVLPGLGTGGVEELNTDLKDAATVIEGATTGEHVRAGAKTLLDVLYTILFTFSDALDNLDTRQRIEARDLAIELVTKHGVVSP